MNRKRKLVKKGEQPNLKRIKQSLLKLKENSNQIDDYDCHADNDCFVLRSKLRKQHRKEERKLKKQRKHASFKGIKLPASIGLNEKLQLEINNKKLLKQQKIERLAERERLEAERRQKEFESKEKEENEKRKLDEFRQSSKKDDLVIKQLEKKLHVKKKNGLKKYSQSFTNEGLDYILDILDNDAFKLSNNKEDEDNYGEHSHDSDYNEKQFNDFSDDNDSDMLSNSGSTDFEEQLGDSEENDSNKELDHDNDDSFSKINNVACEEIVENSEQLNNSNKTDILKEDIYGRTLNSKGQEVKRYVPPALREDKNANNSRITKKIQGLINRLGETNKIRISVDIEEIFKQNSRAIVTDSLSNCIMLACLQQDNISNKAIYNYIELLAIISCSIGFEVYALFLHIIINKWLSLLQNVDSANDDKTIINCTKIICGLYNLKLIKSPMIFDLINKLCSKFTELNAEIVLTIITQCGFALRKDDPIEMKTTLIKIKEFATINESNTSGYSRLNFLIDSLTAIKNNDVRKLPNYDSEFNSNILKDYFNILKQRNLVQVNELNVRLEDIINSETRGKWWLVGAAWNGDNKVDTKKEVTVNIDPQKMEYSDKLLKLATKLRMNTDIKKKIFCTMFSSSDVDDAVNRLIVISKTSVNSKRELINVCVDVLLQGRKNDIFVLNIIKNLSKYERIYNIILSAVVRERIAQYDHDKDSFYDRLFFLLDNFIKTDVIRLNVLKHIDFTRIEPRLKVVVINVLRNILTEMDEENIFKVFSYVTDKLLNHGLQYFLRDQFKQDKYEKSILAAENGLREGLNKRRLK